MNYLACHKAGPALSRVNQLPQGHRSLWNLWRPCGSGFTREEAGKSNSGLEPFDDDHLSLRHPLTMAASLLVQRGPVTRQRLLVRIELDHHATLRGRPPFHCLATPATGQETAAECLEGSRGALGVLLVLLGVGHVHMGDPISLHALLSC